ncbi:MAG: DUF2851 family protein [Muribaculaceae bacterium]|nr:DUF2851 family protein [Muribaculaceae bacterium]
MEKAYHYIWKHLLFSRTATLRDGRSVEVISPGLHNNDAGPDFSRAKILLDGKEWIGNVEIHLRSSDWHRHGHHLDEAYDNIILHVVAFDDTEIFRSDGSAIPQLTLPVAPELLSRIAHLCDNIDDIRCKSVIPRLSPLHITDWLESLASERLHRKAEKILNLVSQYNGDWQRALFITFARSLGFGLNGVPFELLAKSLPLNFVMRHADNYMQIEALLFGQAGMLDSSCNIFDEYYQSLCREYFFLARKYGLKPIKNSLWKYARTRPGNFPHRRIALLASHICSGESLYSRLIQANGDTNHLMEIFNREAGSYWKTHSMFGVECEKLSCRLSSGSIRLLLINVAAPFYMAHSAYLGDPEKGEIGINLLMSLPAEANSIIREWESLGIKPTDSLHSQALIHLRKEYCDPGHCLQCRFGHKFLV